MFKRIISLLLCVVMLTSLLASCDDSGEHDHETHTSEQIQEDTSDHTHDVTDPNEETTDILGLNIPTTRIPVSPGRNLAVIIEIAAMNNKQRRMGYNTAEHFTERLSEFMLKGQALNF